MDDRLVIVLPWKLIGWFSGRFTRFPDRRRTKSANFVGFPSDSPTSFWKASLEAALQRSRILLCRTTIFGSKGLDDLSWSRSRMRGAASGGRFGVKEPEIPEGMFRPEAFRIALRRTFSPWEQDVGGAAGRYEPRSVLKPCQLARRKFVKERLARTWLRLNRR